MSFTRDSTGSWASTLRKVPYRSNESVPRASAGARSNRKPSTCISCTQYRSESVTIARVRGWRRSSVLPQPVTST